MQSAVLERSGTAGDREDGLRPMDVAEIDTYSKFLFPAAFAVFHSLYWVAYLWLIPHNVPSDHQALPL